MSIRCFLLCMVSIASSLPAASQDIVFQDSFERKQLGDDWLVILPSFTIRDGRLLGHEEPERGHGAVCRAPVEFQNGKFEFSFRLTDGQSFNFVVNDKNCKEVHAGHICRVSISAKLVRISDDREGAMRNDLFAALRDPKQNLDRRKVLKDREILIPNTLAADQWHHVSISIVDDQMSVTIDGKQIGQLKSPGIAHATKTDFGFTVVGNEIEFDDVRMSR